MSIASLSANKAILVAQFLRTRAWWRPDSAGASALRVARSAVSLLDAAAYLLDLPQDDPDLLALEAMGCFRAVHGNPGMPAVSVPQQARAALTHPLR